MARECRVGGVRGRRGGAASDLELGTDEVDTGDLFGDGVLHLEAGIGLDEGEGGTALRGVKQELEGAQAATAHLACEPEGGVREHVAERCGERWAGGDLDNLLVAALDAAFALPEVADVARAIADHLDFDVAGARDQLFDVDIAVAERGLRLRLAAPVGGFEIVWPFDHAHSPSPAAGDRLDHHCAAGAEAFEEGVSVIRGGGAIGAGEHRDVQPCR